MFQSSIYHLHFTKNATAKTGVDTFRQTDVSEDHPRTCRRSAEALPIIMLLFTNIHTAPLPHSIKYTKFQQLILLHTKDRLMQSLILERTQNSFAIIQRVKSFNLSMNARDTHYLKLNWCHMKRGSNTAAQTHNSQNTVAMDSVILVVTFLAFIAFSRYFQVSLFDIFF